MKIIKVRVIGSYGNPLTYPACDTSRAFAQIAGTKTLTPKVVRLIKELGFGVEVMPPELPVEAGELCD
jgi:hypothetical protein